MLEGLENEAREAKKGLWADPQPMPPWEWRREPVETANGVGKMEEIKSSATESSTVQNTDESKGIGMDLSLRELNPNHKYRMALMGLPMQVYWLAELGVVKADESLYLMPLFHRASILTLADSNSQVVRHQVFPNSGLHLSFHDSGAVNLFLGSEKLPLRARSDKPTTIGPLFAIVVNSTASLAQASIEEINTSPADKRVLPLIAGWSDSPVGLTVYRSMADVIWTAPILADLVQVNVHLPVRGKSVMYHVVVWQNRHFQQPPSEVSIYMPT